MNNSRLVERIYNRTLEKIRFIQMLFCKSSRFILTALFVAQATTYAVAAAGGASSKIDELLTEAKFSSPSHSKMIGDQVLAMDPKSGDAYSLLAFAKYNNGSYDEAIELCKKALNLKFRMPFYQRTTLNYLYHCYLAKQEWKPALQHALECFKFQRSAAVAHDLSILYNKVGDPRLSNEYRLLENQISTHQGVQFEHHMKLFSDAQNPKTVARALAEANEKLAKDPKDDEALSLRSHCYVTKKDYKKALADLDTLLYMYPTRGYVHYRRAQVYKLMGDAKNSAIESQTAKAHGFDIEKIKQSMEQYKRNKAAKGTAHSGK